MEELEIETLSEPLMPKEDRFSDNDTPISQVQPLLGTTHRENLQLWNRNQLEDISDVLGTTAFQGYINTPLQTLNGIVVQQPKRFLPLAEEAKCLVEEICIEKLNEQWAGIPHEKLLNQSFWDQLGAEGAVVKCLCHHLSAGLAAFFNVVNSGDIVRRDTNCYRDGSAGGIQYCWL